MCVQRSALLIFGIKTLNLALAFPHNKIVIWVIYVCSVTERLVKHLRRLEYQPHKILSPMERGRFSGAFNVDLSATLEQ